jgi:multiple sugar transport system substrate-binding protein
MTTIQNTNALGRWLARGLMGGALATLLAGTAFAQTKTIRVWHTETSPASQAAVAEIVKRFEATRPGVKVQAEALAWNDLEGKIMASLAAGSPPEVAHGQPITCSALRQQGLLLPVDDVIAKLPESNLLPRYKKVCAADGKVYGLVHASGTSLLIYRKDLAAKKGVKPAKTWDEFIKVAEALTIDDNKDGKPEIYGLTIPGDNLFINILMGEMIAANGGKLFDDKNKPQFDSKQMAETLDYWKRLAKFMPPGWEGHGYLDTFANLYGQKAAMMYAGYGRGASLIEQYAPENMRNTDTFDVWLKPHGPSGKSPAAQVDEETWMLFKGSANPELAKEFLSFFYKDENYVEYIKSVPIHFFPITKSLRANAAYKDIPMVKRWASWLQVQEDYLNNDQAKPTLTVDWSDLDTKPYLMKILGSGILRDMVLDVAVEGKPIDQAMKRGQQRAEQIVRQAGAAKW